MDPQVNQYFSRFEGKVLQRLLEIRETILATNPLIKEGFSYQMPAYGLNKPVVYFAAYKRHIGFYPTGSGIKAAEVELKKRNLTYSKGAIQFPHDREIPIDLINNIVRFKLEEFD